MELDFTLFLVLVSGLLGTGCLYLYIKNKRVFNNLRAKFGKNVDKIYGYSTVENLVKDLTEKIDIWLDVEFSIVIGLHGEKFPFAFGDVIRPNQNSTGRTIEKAFYLIADEESKYVLEEYPNIFELAESSGKLSVYWILDFKSLNCLLSDDEVWADLEKKLDALLVKSQRTTSDLPVSEQKQVFRRAINQIIDQIVKKTIERKKQDGHFRKYLERINQVRGFTERYIKRKFGE